jgi:mono/diheme cytochrome c family protein
VHDACEFRCEDFLISRSSRLSWAPVTEIPEHLLKRSKAARTQAEGGTPATSDAGAAAPGTAAATTSATTPAVPTPAAPPATPAGPPPPKPDIPVVAAAKARKKIPFWAFATLSTLPLWAFMYVRALTPAAERVAGPLGEGAVVFAGCSGCHGSRGEGGVGYAFSGQEVLKTFPHIEDQLRWVYAGTDAYVAAGVEIYGDPNRAGGAHITKAKGAMPQQGEKYGGGLTEAEILAVVCHERFTVGGADPLGANETEFDNWCAEDSPAWTSLEDGSATFDNIDTVVPDAIKVGTDPVAGSSAGS